MRAQQCKFKTDFNVDTASDGVVIASGSGKKSCERKNEKKRKISDKNRTARQSICSCHSAVKRNSVNKRFRKNCKDASRSNKQSKIEIKINILPQTAKLTNFCDFRLVVADSGYLR